MFIFAVKRCCCSHVQNPIYSLPIISSYLPIHQVYMVKSSLWWQGNLTCRTLNGVQRVGSKLFFQNKLHLVWQKHALQSFSRSDTFQKWAWVWESWSVWPWNCSSRCQPCSSGLPLFLFMLLLFCVAVTNAEIFLEGRQHSMWSSLALSIPSCGNELGVCRCVVSRWLCLTHS